MNGDTDEAVQNLNTVYSASPGTANDPNFPTISLFWTHSADDGSRKRRAGWSPNHFVPLMRVQDPKWKKIGSTIDISDEEGIPKKQDLEALKKLFTKVL